MQKHIPKFDKTTTILLLCTIAWMVIIFMFSAQPAGESADLSRSLLDKIAYIVGLVLGKGAPDVADLIILGAEQLLRKAGHVVEYFVLGILVASFIGRLSFKRYNIMSILVCAIYASSDEFHQMFVPGRGPSLTDVFLDVFAALVGMLIFYKLIRYLSKRNLKV